MQKDVKFENNSEIKDFSEYSENKLAIAKICVLSTAPNCHGLIISEEVLRRDIGSIRGNFLVADMEFGDATTHTDDEVPVGYFLPNEPIEFEVVETDDDRIVKAWAYAVLSKRYAKSAYDMFVNDNQRATSIEMTVELADDEKEVLSLDAYGSTILGKLVRPSCKEAEISLVRFAQDATELFNKEKEANFADSDEKEKYENHPIDSSKEAMVEEKWDGDKAKQDLVKEKNYKTLAPKICLKLEEGWEDREVTKLGYPVMGLYQGEWRYNRNALASALAYAKQENETSVVNKLNKIYKNLGLDQDGKEEDTKMAEIEFAAVDIGDMWNKLWDALHAKYPDGDYSSVYRVEGIYEEDNKKFAIIRHRDEDARYRLDFSLTEDGITLADEVVKVELEIVETDVVKKFAEPEDAEKYKEFAEPEQLAESEHDDDHEEDEHDDDHDDDKDEHHEEMSADEMKAEMARLQCEVDNRDNIIMEKDTKMSEMEAELSELREFKMACDKEKLNACVETFMSEVKDNLSEEQFKDLRNKGFECKMSEIDGWKNLVKASCFDAVSKKVPKKAKDETWSFSVPVETEPVKKNSLWD